MKPVAPVTKTRIRFLLSLDRRGYAALRLRKSQAKKHSTICLETDALMQTERRGILLVGAKQADHFGATPFDLRTMPIGHTLKKIVNRTFSRCERERFFNLARDPFLSVRHQTEALANRFQRGDFIGEGTDRIGGS